MNEARRTLLNDERISLIFHTLKGFTLVADKPAQFQWT